MPKQRQSTFGSAVGSVVDFVEDTTKSVTHEFGSTIRTVYRTGFGAAPVVKAGGDAVADAGGAAKETLQGAGDAVSGIFDSPGLMLVAGAVILYMLRSGSSGGTTVVTAPAPPL